MGGQKQHVFTPLLSRQPPGVPKYALIIDSALRL